MKKILILILLVGFHPSLFAQGNNINLDKSVVKWKGSHLTGLNPHYGSVHFKKGFLKYKENKVSEGNFVIDMNTITNTDGEYNKGLVEHLKNEDFFDVPKFPTATLKIIRVDHDWIGAIMTVYATLTIKGISQDIQFKAESINTEKDTVLKSKFSIDRSKWNIKYGSSSFFDNLGDDVISDTIEFEIEIVLNNC